jgi:hypothetical protein
MMAMSTPTPQAVLPVVTKTLAIAALLMPVLGSISFDLYNYVTECCQFEDFWSLLIPC